jgi:hypothetical protein
MRSSTPATLLRGRTVTGSEEEDGTRNGISCVEVMGEMVGTGDRMEEGEQIGELGKEEPPLLTGSKICERLFQTRIA